MTSITADVIKCAIMKWPGRYETEAGEQFLGAPVSTVAGALRDAGWRNVPRFDEYNLKELGLKVVTARYVGGARPKRFCDVVVAKDLA